METNNIDKTIKEKFENRTLTPSASAWERLSVQLNEQQKNTKKPWFLYVSIAASVLILMVLGIQFFTTEKQEIIPIKEVVTTPLQEIKTEVKPIENANQTLQEEAIANNNVPKKQTHTEEKKTSFEVLNEPKNKSIAIVTIDEKEIENSEKQTNNATISSPKDNKIKVNADALLYAVSHNTDEVKKYYAQHQINRDELLQTIENELKKSKLKVNPETILVEVERTITEDAFQNNFLQFLKKRVSDIAVAIANRNE